MQERLRLLNSYDVVQIFAFGWAHMSWDQKKRVRDEIAPMMNWCLSDMIEKGTFKNDGEGEIDTYYFGVRFLDTIGYWRNEKGFWYTGDPSLPAKLPKPYDTCRSMKAAFANIDDGSGEAGEVVRLLNLAIAETSTKSERRKGRKLRDEASAVIRRN